MYNSIENSYGSELEKKLLKELTENIDNLDGCAEIIKSLLEIKPILKIEINKQYMYEYSKSNEGYIFKKYDNGVIFEEIYYDYNCLPLKAISYLETEDKENEVHSIKYYENGKPTIKEGYFENKINEITTYNTETRLYIKETCYSDYKRKVIWSETNYDPINGYKIHHIEYFRDKQIVDYMFKYNQNKKNKINYYIENDEYGNPKKIKSFIKFIYYKIRSW